MIFVINNELLCLTIHYVYLRNIIHLNRDKHGCCGTMVLLQFNC
jgi:hypothetical protein